MVNGEIYFSRGRSIRCIVMLADPILCGMVAKRYLLVYLLQNGHRSGHGVLIVLGESKASAKQEKQHLVTRVCIK